MRSSLKNINLQQQSRNHSTTYVCVLCVVLWFPTELTIVINGEKNGGRGGRRGSSSNVYSENGSGKWRRITTICSGYDGAGRYAMKIEGGDRGEELELTTATHGECDRETRRQGTQRRRRIWRVSDDLNLRRSTLGSYGKVHGLIGLALRERV